MYKKDKQILQRYYNSDKYKLRQCYNRYSSDKENAFNACYNEYLKDVEMFGYDMVHDFKIIGYNCDMFSCGWVVENDFTCKTYLRYFTSHGERKIYI